MATEVCFYEINKVVRKKTDTASLINYFKFLE